MLQTIRTLALLILLALPASAQGWAFQPGEAFGPIALGMTPDQVAAHLNVTEVIGSARSPRFVRYGVDRNDEEVLVEYAAGRAVMVSVHKSQIQTKSGPVRWLPLQGITIGSPWATVQGILGRASDSEALKVASGHPAEIYYAYGSRGLGFRTKGGSVVQIDVWEAK